MGLVDEWNGEMGVDLGIKVLEIEFDLDVIVLIIADLLAEAILVLSLILCCGINPNLNPSVFVEIF